jgi:RNA polymerase sigma-70 factor (ECF subfamily)
MYGRSLTPLYMAGEDMEEKILVQKILDGDDDAKGLLVSQLRPRLWITSSHFLGLDDPEIEDAVQETFLKAFKAMGQFKFKASLYTWVNHICVNTCFHKLKQRQQRMESLGQDLDALSMDLAKAHHIERQEQDVREARMKVMREIIPSLGEPCATLVKKHHLEGASIVSLADETRVPVGTVMGRLARCREALKKRIEAVLVGRPS